VRLPSLPRAILGTQFVPSLAVVQKLKPGLTYGPTVIVTDPVAPAPVPVMVTMPTPPTRVPRLVSAELRLMMLGSLLVKVVWLVTSLPFSVAVNATAVLGGAVVKLMLLPSEDATASGWVVVPMVTVTFPVAELPEDEQLAVMIAVDGVLVTAVTRPELLTLATVAAELVQVQEPVRICVVPSLKLPVAVSCTV